LVETNTVGHNRAKGKPLERVDRLGFCVAMANEDTGGLDERGHLADSPRQMPAKAWKDIAKRTLTRTWQDNVGLVAAGVTYYGFLALVPLLGIIVMLYGLFADPQTVVVNIRAITTILPPDVSALISDQLIAAVQTTRETRGMGVVVALLVALYGGTNGSSAIMMALNIAYEEKEKRALGRFYLVAALMTVGAVILAVAALVATTTVAFLGNFAPDASPSLVFAAKLVGYFGLTLAAAAVAATLYRFVPSREDARWRWITPGSAFAAVTWLLLTLLFSFWVTRITDYDVTYGSLGTIIILLTWIYLSAYALIFGAELNSEIEHQTARDSTTGSPLPMGRRGAWAADHVAEDDEPDRTDAPSMAEASPDAPNAKEEDRTARPK
jgi:membrane protein